MMLLPLLELPVAGFPIAVAALWRFRILRAVPRPGSLLARARSFAHARFIAMAWCSGAHAVGAVILALIPSVDRSLTGQAYGNAQSAREGSFVAVAVLGGLAALIALCVLGVVGIGETVLAYRGIRAYRAAATAIALAREDDAALPVVADWGYGDARHVLPPLKAKPRGSKIDDAYRTAPPPPRGVIVGDAGRLGTLLGALVVDAVVGLCIVFQLGIDLAAGNP